jgi:hypothetical protein
MVMHYIWKAVETYLVLSLTFCSLLGILIAIGEVRYQRELRRLEYLVERGQLSVNEARARLGIRLHDYEEER